MPFPYSECVLGQEETWTSWFCSQSVGCECGIFSPGSFMLVLGWSVLDFPWFRMFVVSSWCLTPEISESFTQGN